MAETDPLYAEALARLRELFEQAARLPLIEPWAVTLATAGLTTAGGEINLSVGGTVDDGAGTTIESTGTGAACSG